MNITNFTIKTSPAGWVALGQILRSVPTALVIGFHHSGEFYGPSSVQNRLRYEDEISVAISIPNDPDTRTFGTLLAREEERPFGTGIWKEIEVWPEADDARLYAEEGIWPAAADIKRNVGKKISLPGDEIPETWVIVRYDDPVLVADEPRLPVLLKSLLTGETCFFPINRVLRALHPEKGHLANDPHRA